MSKFFLTDKKGVSVLIAYVLLIVIAIGLGVGVYTWLKTQVPNQTEECPAGISLVISDIICGEDLEGDDVGENEIKILFRNKGTFDIDGAYIRIGNDLTNNNPVFEIKPIDTTSVPGREGFFYFGIGGLRAATGEKSIKFNFKDVYESGGSSRINEEGINVIQVQPFIVNSETKKIVLCEKSSFTKEHECSA